MERKTAFIIGIIITFFYLLISLLIMNDYGLSWDFHYHHFAGLYHLGLPVPKITEEAPVPFSPPDPRLTVEDPFGPFTQILPTLAYLIFYQKLKILPIDSAYNLPAVLFGSLGVGLIYFFMLEAASFEVALFSALFLALLPNYFGYLHTNMKDIPSAFAFTLAVYLFWRLLKFRRVKDLIWSILAFAFAFNVKINSLLIPVVNFLWYTTVKKNHLVILYFVLLPVAAIILWWPFWRDPIKKLLELPYFYSHNTFHMPVLIAGKIYRSAVNIPWFYPYIFIGITTPLPILISFIFGLLISVRYMLSKNKIYILLIIWFFVPLLRYFDPKVSAIDGVRHFMEVLYPLSAIGGVGVYWLYQYLRKVMPSYLIINFVVISILLFLIRNIIVFHPYQTSFFNVITGGIKGAYKNYDIDYWGTPQREAMNWLNKNVPFNSTIYVVMAQSSAGIYLRDDLLQNLNRKDIWTSDYTVILNRESFFEMYNLYKYFKERKNEDIVYTKLVEGVPLVWVYKNLR